MMSLEELKKLNQQKPASPFFILEQELDRTKKENEELKRVYHSLISNAELEQLREEREKYRKALEDIIKKHQYLSDICGLPHCDECYDYRADELVDISREALKEREDE